MSPQLARFTSRARTWILIAGLTALVVAIGARLGGAWLWIFTIGALLFNLAGYWFSDRVALGMSRAQPLPESAAPELHADVADLARRAGIPTPRLYLIPQEQPNAFATGRNPAHAAVAVTEGLIRYLPRDQVRGVIAHELGHVRNRDILVTTTASMLGAVITSIAQFAFLFGGSHDDEDSPLGAIGSLLLLLVAPIAAMLVQLAVSRQREYLADATAAQLIGDSRPLADALRTLERGTEALPMAVNPATASLYIANPLAGGGVASLFSTHPPMAERIRRLEALRLA